MREVMVHEPGDEVLTIAQDGSVRKFTVLQNGDLVLEEGAPTQPISDPAATAVMQAPRMPVDDGSVRPPGVPRGGWIPTAEDVLRAFVAVSLQHSSMGQVTVTMEEVFRYTHTRLSVRYVADDRQWLIRWP